MTNERLPNNNQMLITKPENEGCLANANSEAFANAQTAENVEIVEGRKNMSSGIWRMVSYKFFF